MKHLIPLLLALLLLAACGTRGPAPASQPESRPSPASEEAPIEIPSEQPPIEPEQPPMEPEPEEAPQPLQSGEEPDSSSAEQESNYQRANALFSDLSAQFSLSKDSYSYFTCYSGGGPVTLEVGVTDEAAVDAYLAAWTGTKWDELRKVPGRASQARQEEFAQEAEKLDLGPDISFHVMARNGPSLTETGRILIVATVTGTELLEDIPQEIKDLAEEMGVPEDMFSFLCNAAP